MIDKAHWETLTDTVSNRLTSPVSTLFTIYERTQDASCQKSNSKIQHESTGRVWGAAYHIPASHVKEVREYLDIREINGYSIQFTPFHPAISTAEVTSPPHDSEPSESERGMWAGIRATNTVSVTEEAGSIKCLVYIGLPENPQFLGAQDPDALARKILESMFGFVFATVGLFPTSRHPMLIRLQAKDQVARTRSTFTTWRLRCLD